jgi:hypothetical protein
LEKKKYYLTVGHSGEIMEDPTASTYELEIEATPEEIADLEKMYRQLQRSDTDTFWRAHIPFLQYHYDQDNDEYDQRLTDIYRMIHKLGTPETKQHIESMGLLH